ncbi:MAG TPA: hypothetical protein DEA22_06390, partial [Blastocatellia bacterium]|nr:hypothetical protein [Blastocatellia bacterium]
ERKLLAAAGPVCAFLLDPRKTKTLALPVISSVGTRSSGGTGPAILRDVIIINVRNVFVILAGRDIFHLAETTLVKY